MYSDAVKTTGNEGKIEVRDLIQLIAEAVGVEEPVESEAVWRLKQLAAVAWLRQATVAERVECSNVHIASLAVSVPKSIIIWWKIMGYTGYARG